MRQWGANTATNGDSVQRQTASGLQYCILSEMVRVCVRMPVLWYELVMLPKQKYL